ncbi:unnamed protein product [Closterium sp. NIES-64]|nr:unnamed protein product [Closterium sp. NIES-64]
MKSLSVSRRLLARVVAAAVAAAAEEAAEAAGAAAAAAAGASSVTEPFQNSSYYPSAVSTTVNAVRSTSAAVLTVQQLSARAACIMRSTPWGRLTRPDVWLPHVQAFSRFLEASHRSLLQSLKIPSSAIFHSALEMLVHHNRRLHDEHPEGGWSEELLEDTSGVSYSTAPVRWRGVCRKTDDFTACSRKVVGARYFLKGAERAFGQVDTMDDYLSPSDMQQHGTSCAGAAAGNAGVEVTVGGRTFGTASRMAPRARLAVYKALWMVFDSNYGVKGKGATSDLIAAAEKAVADGVDVIFCSWGGLALYFQDLPYLRGLKAGVVTAFAAGNKGRPKRMKLQGTLSNASPFYLTVGARPPSLFTSTPANPHNLWSFPPTQQEHVKFELTPQHVKFELTPQHVKFELTPQHVKFELTPQHVKFELTPQHVKFELTPQHVKFELTPQHVKFELTPQHVKFELTPQHVKFELTPQHVKFELTPQHVKFELTPQHSKFELTSQHVKFELTPQHVKFELTSQHAKFELTPQHAKFELTPQHAKLELTPQHVKFELTPQHVKFELTPQHVKFELTPQHVKFELTPQHAKFELTPQHVKFELTPQHVKFELTPQHVKFELTPQHVKFELTPQHVKFELTPQLVKFELTPQHVNTMGRDYTQFHPPTPAYTTAPSLITMGQDYTAVLTLGDGTTFTERIQSPFHSMHSVHPPTPPCTTAPSLITMGRDYTTVLTLGDGTTFTEHIQSPFHSTHSVHPPTPPCTTAPFLSTMGRDYTAVLTLAVEPPSQGAASAATLPRRHLCPS